MPVFDHLLYVYDVSARTGSKNMAFDQCLLEQARDYPVLRIYDWSEPSVSFGYFHKLNDVKDACPSGGNEPISYVRRWTGGGIVDHRFDVTYTLVVPRGHAVGQMRGSSSYHVIHDQLCEALKKLGQNVELSHDDQGGGALCFNNPVTYDLTDSAGRKVAGAGQRRTRHGLLHQGSVLCDLNASDFGQMFASHLAASHEIWLVNDDFNERVAEIDAERYASETWLNKR